MRNRFQRNKRNIKKRIAKRIKRIVIIKRIKANNKNKTKNQSWTSGKNKNARKLSMIISNQMIQAKL